MKIKELRKMMRRLDILGRGNVQIQINGEMYEVDQEQSGFKISSDGKKVLYLTPKTEDNADA